ncbi:hypothetical protein FSP39_005298 [Pinctada imbricata]|uniref:MULE transposase domain-containing protein n=1 Tax=Pinctada imbricata TaxID=66713 RepID=A0AA89BJ50_PINIB|nr:hypothetical protein FSP39_005298 [Pinctada imbricata]
MPITESLSCTDVPQTNATFVISSDRSCADTIPYVSTFDDATIPYDIDSPTSRNSKGQPTKFSPVNSEGQHNSCSPIFEQIPHGGLNAKDIMALVTSKEKRVYNTVPSGRKENVYFVVDNQKNKKNGHDQRRRVFFDDCGVWNTSRRTTIRDHIATEGMKSVTLRNGVYCTEKTVKGTKQWVPLSPQPERKDVVQIHRYYTSLRADENFKRIVIWVTSTSRPELDNVAIYQYQGKFPEVGCEQPHGNAKENGRPYKRTDPKQLEKVRDEPDEKKPKKIYREMVLNDSINAPRDIKLIRNARYTQRVKDHGKVTGNAADEILSLISSIDQHPYVQKIEHTKNNVPAIILYDDDQLEDFRFFVRSRTEYRVGIDRTFNLGPYFVTCVVYKNIRVVRNDTSGHPIFLGPVLLHKEATFETYHYFFSHLKAKLSIDLNRIDLAIPGFFEFGSDDEKALVKALDSCFPNAQRALCTKHLKDNVTCYLRDKAGVTREDRRVISNLIFGQRGLVNAEDSFEFQQRSTRIIRASTQFPRFLQYFERNLQNRIRDYVNAPRRNSDLDSSLWTNNNAESMNHVLKVAANWQPKSITDLVELLYNEVKLQLTDLRRSLHGDGNYRLAVQFQRYALKKSVIMTMPRDRRLQLFRNFLRDTKKTSRPSHIVSKNGKLAVANKLNKVARKPGQRQRLKSHRTRDRNL